MGQSVHFAGHVITDKGVMPDPEMLKAIADFPTPKDVTALRSFLGLANQLSCFLPDAAHATMKMRQLLKKKNAFAWLPDHEREFEAAKKLLVSASIVRYFDPSLDTVLLADASRLYGIGFALMQTAEDGSSRLIRAGSTSLSPTQSRYATIELELLAIEHAVSKCAFYLKGMHRPFKVITDHRPLVGVLQKPLHDVDNPRLQRMRGHLDGSGYVFNVEWAPGKEHLIADALSRAPVFRPDEEADAEYRVARVKDDAMGFFREPASAAAYKQCADALRRGVSYSDLPPHHPARALKNVWDNLSVHDQDDVVLIVLDGHRIFVPESARQSLLAKLHLPHAGISKTREQARQLYYWPGMSNDVRQMVEACEVCLAALPSQTEEPFVEREEPDMPMMSVGVDLCEYAGQMWLVMVDRLSGFPFATKLRRTATSDITRELLKWFYDWGFPRVIRSDGGPQFRRDFQLFCKDNFIRHEVSSPYNPQSNGLAEAAVKNVKRMIKKCTSKKTSFAQALFEFRNLPRTDGFSPAQMLLGRRQRGALPTLDAALAPVDAAAAVEARRGTADAAATRHDAHARALSKLGEGDRVCVQDPVTRVWDKYAVIISVQPSGRSFELEFEDSGKCSARNRRYLRPVSGSRQAQVPPARADAAVSGPTLRRSSRLAAKDKGASTR
jgi:hypothetical protein